MDSVGLLAALGAVMAVLIFAVAWLSLRLKEKNRQLRQALADLQARKKDVIPRKPELVPIIAAQPAPGGNGSQPQALGGKVRQATIDAFLWEHLADAFLWAHLANPEPSPSEIKPACDASIPCGMCTPAGLQQLLASNPAFTGLVVLIGMDEGQSHRFDGAVEDFIRELLGPTDLAGRRSQDEFLLVCCGLPRAEAQRRLNEISERLWSFQRRGQGAFSLLFSWGGIGIENQPLSEAIASATARMQQTKRSRLTLINRKAG